MPEYKFTNVLGTFYFDEKQNLLEEKSGWIPHKTHIDAVLINENNIYKHNGILRSFRTPENLSKFRELNISFSAEQLKKAANDDNFIIQTSRAMDEVLSLRKVLVKRLAEWVGLFNPGMEQSSDAFVFDLTIGSWTDHKPLRYLSDEINALSTLNKRQDEYLIKIMQRHCPNLLAVAGTTVGSKLICHSGSIEVLSKMPSARIQMLGGEKEFFSSGKKKAVIGIIGSHPLIKKAENKPKASKIFSDKLSMAVKVDFFKGDPIGDKLFEELKNRLKEL